MILNGDCPRCKKKVGLVGDKETKKAHCEICDSEIQCNSFLVLQLIQDKKVRGIKITTGSAYDLYCSKCKAKEPPIFKNNNLHCVRCDYDFASVNKIILNNLKTRLINRDKEVND